MSSKAEVLRRIRASLGRADGAGPRRQAGTEGYRRTDEAGSEELIERFIEMVSDYRGTIRRVAAASVAIEVARAVEERGAKRLAVPEGFPAEWIPEGPSVVGEAADATTLATVDGVITTCALAIALTGTIVLDGGPGQGRRLMTLIPDYHLCIVRADQLVGIVPQAVARLQHSVASSRPITFISGPSATSDIELRRVEGVHGPRTLEVLLVS